MVHRGTNDGHAQRDVDRRAKALVLEHRQALIVIHGQYRIGVFKICRGKHAVGRQRANQIHSLRAQPVQYRNDDVDFLAAKVAILTGMRIETTNNDARVLDAELVGQLRVQDAGYTFHPLGGNRICYRTQRQMSGYQANAQTVGSQHHDDLIRTGQLLQKLGMAGKGNTGVIDDALVGRRGNHCSKQAVKTALPCPGQGVQYIAGVGRIELTGHCRFGQIGLPDINRAGRGRLLWQLLWIYRDHLQRLLQLGGALGQQAGVTNHDNRVRLLMLCHIYAQIRANTGWFAGGKGKTKGHSCLIST